MTVNLDEIKEAIKESTVFGLYKSVGMAEDSDIELIAKDIAQGWEGCRTDA